MHNSADRRPFGPAETGTRALRVIHTLTSGQDVITGIYRSVRELAIAQRDIGVEVHIVAQGRWPDDEIGSHGVQLHEGGAVQSIKRIRALASEGAVIHTHTLWRGVALAPLLMGRRRPRATAVMSPHNCLADAALSSKSAKKRAGWRLIFRRALAAHDMLIATSDQERSETERYASGLPIAVLPGANPPPDRATIESVGKAGTVGYLGRLHPIKGVRELALAWASVAPGAPGWRLRIVGPANDEKYVRELQAIAAAAGSIDIEPPLSGADKWRFLASCELVAVPSKTEGSPNVIVEAFLAGTPVLTTLGVPWPQIGSEGMGWRGDGSVEGLAAMLRQAVAASARERACMGRIGKAFAERNHGARDIAVQSLRIYQEAKAVGSRTGRLRPGLAIQADPAAH